MTVEAFVRALDLYVVAARCEGGPQSIVECASNLTPIISTDVGIASSVLAPESIADEVRVKSLLEARPDSQTAQQRVARLWLPGGMEPFRSALIAAGSPR